MNYSDANLTETLKESSEAYTGDFLRIRKDLVALPNATSGSPLASREYVVHPGACMVVPIFDRGTVLIERQYRHPCRKIFTEFPAGKIDPGEDPLNTALRELREETGYQAGEIAHVTTIHNAIAYSDEHIEIYFARGLTQVADVAERALDAGELINCSEVTVEWLLQELLAGRLTDVKTQIGLWWLLACQAGQVPWPQFAPVSRTG